MAGQNICGHNWDFGPFLQPHLYSPSPYFAEMGALNNLAKLAVVFSGHFYSFRVNILGLRFIL